MGYFVDDDGLGNLDGCRVVYIGGLIGGGVQVPRVSTLVFDNSDA